MSTIIELISQKHDLLCKIELKDIDKPDTKVVFSNNIIFLDESNLRENEPYMVINPINQLRFSTDETEFQLLLNWAKFPDKINWNAIKRDGIFKSVLFPDRKNIPISEYIIWLLKSGILTENLKNKFKDVVYFKPEYFPTPSFQPAGFPRLVAFFITERCNLRCRHCFTSALKETVKTDRRSIKELSTEELKNYFDLCDSYGTCSIDLGGGEPTVRKDFPELLQHAVSKRFLTNISSNGMFNQDILDLIISTIKNKNGQGISIQFSLDGATPESHDHLRGKKGAFNHLIEVMQTFKQNNISYSIETCLYQRNLNEIEKIIELCGSYGSKGVTFHPIKLAGRADHELLIDFNNIKKSYQLVKRLSRQLKNEISLDYVVDYIPENALIIDSLKKERLSRFLRNLGNLGSNNPHFLNEPAMKDIPTCIAGMTMMCIDSQGGVIPCSYSVGHSEFVIDSLRHKNIMDIWRSSKWDFYRGGWQAEELNVCKECKWQNGCSTQVCRVIPKISLNDYYGPSPYCLHVCKDLGIEEQADTYIKNYCNGFERMNV